jgi:hypothetical protein
VTLNYVQTLNLMLKLQDVSSTCFCHRYSASVRFELFRWLKRWVPGLRDFEKSEKSLLRNSYRSVKCHIYETVKLNQIELSNQINYSESEKRYKAFIEHDLV